MFNRDPGVGDSDDEEEQMEHLFKVINRESTVIKEQVGLTKSHDIVLRLEVQLVISSESFKPAKV